MFVKYWYLREKVSTFIKAGLFELGGFLLAMLLSRILIPLVDDKVGEKFDISDILMSIQGIIDIVAWICLTLCILTYAAGLAIHILQFRYYKKEKRKEKEDA